MAATTRSVGQSTSIATTSVSVRVLITPLTSYAVWAPSWVAVLVELPWSSARNGRPLPCITAKSSSVLFAPAYSPRLNWLIARVLEEPMIGPQAVVPA